MKFKDLFESKATVSQVNKVIKSIDFDILRPEAYEVSLFDTDAGLGGEKVVRVYSRSDRTKDQSDNQKVKKALEDKFGTDKVTQHSKNLLIVR